jgi:hypothetical protein
MTTVCQKHKFTFRPVKYRTSTNYKVITNSVHTVTAQLLHTVTAHSCKISIQHLQSYINTDYISWQYDPSANFIERRRQSTTEFIKQIYKNQYRRTNVMHFSFNLLTIKGLYMFRALLAYPQEALHKQHLVYRVRVMSAGRHQFHSNAGEANWHNTHAIYQVPLVQRLLRMSK